MTVLHLFLRLDEELKPRCCLVLEEDEGFGDWSHRLENRNEQEGQDDCKAREQTPSAPQCKPGPEEAKQQEDEEGAREPDRSSRSQEASTRTPGKVQSLADQHCQYWGFRMRVCVSGCV